jgi:hypothetical protein
MEARSPSTGNVAGYFEGLVRDAFEAQGWSVTAAPSSDCDILVSFGDGVSYAVEVKVARDARLPHLEALLADAFMRARRAAFQLDVRPLAIVGAPGLTDRAADQLRDYARTYLDGAAYGLIDAQGRLELHGPGLEGVRAAESRLDVERVRSPASFDPFSDLNQWMLKVLLAERLPPELLAAPRQPVRNAHQLANLAEVSVPSASRFVAHMKRGGWLGSDERHIEPLRLEELMHRWQSFNGKQASELRAKWLLPSNDPRAQLDRCMATLHERGHTEGSRACVALFAAAERLGYAHARGIMQHIYYEGDPGRVLEALGAAPAQENEGADLALRRPPFRESVFRGMVIRDGIPVSDALQVWLDVASQPARGQEQAEYMWRRLIAPSLLRRAEP